MLKLVLLTVVLTLIECRDIVVIKYTKPILSFTLTADNRGIQYVVFTFLVKDVRYKTNGVITSEGWQYQTSQINLLGVDKVEAYATAYDQKHGIRLKTPKSTLLLKNDQHLPRPGRRIRGAVIFRDDFNSINPANWDYEISMYGGMTWEFQVYTNEPRNVFTKNGMLYIQPTPTISDPRFDDNFLRNGVMDVANIWGYCTNKNNYGCHREGKFGLLPPVMSGKIMSKPTLRYGIVEIRARIPKGDWLWPGISMLPRQNVYGEFPRSGQIDIMESRGNPGPYGVNSFSSTLHWGVDWKNDRWQFTTVDKRGNSWHESFHTWRLEWTPNSMNIFVDNDRVLEVRPDAGFWNLGRFTGRNIWGAAGKMAPFDTDFFMSLKVSVGGVSGYFSDERNWERKKPWADNSLKAAEDFWNGRNEWLPTWQGDKAALIVDWVEFKNF
ncbi:beta-1,3-glucan-binding protein-like isoform X2 [Biomphalaria glabrata]|uniref:Beta-1,3-glucan-binding protein-like isoform X2 n=1 Tax=Biomphalaria glabrata TaxID=6526 RepID=A0A9W3ATQ1_BIOGL|nr:beta-1,3-glucan-binding protein-like isoform X2 [Biomphalaria glabrata]